MSTARHIALNFGSEPHFYQGVPEFARQLAMHIAECAPALRAVRDWHFHYYLPKQWHGMFGDAVRYYPVSRRLRYPHRGPVPFDVWHGLHQHLRYRPPSDSRCNLITVHDLNYVHVKTGLSLWRHARRHRRCLSRADQIIAVSNQARADILRHLPGAPPSRVIHNGVADLSRVPLTSVPELEHARFCLHISRMAHNKNVESLLALAAAWPEQRFVLAGPVSRHVQKHQEYCRARRLENVRFLTDVTEGVKAWLYANCQAFLFPSTLEGFGMPPIEAMFFGKPVVVARRSSLPEVCGTAAQYWDVFEPSAMRTVLRDVLHQVESGRWRPDVVRAHAMRYEWKKVAERYLEAYTRCLRQAPGACTGATA
jgi:glycosyltransferase involved in cell wall biosynthesis